MSHALWTVVMPTLIPRFFDAVPLELGEVFWPLRALVCGLSGTTLRAVCEAGLLETAKWLTRTHKLTAADARANDNEALRLSCENGHLEVAKWLTTTFGLTAYDARTNDNEALRFSCANGHLEVAKWLTATTPGRVTMMHCA